MGFGKRERDKIIDIGVVLFRNPIGLGQFICRTNYVPATKIKAIMAEMAKVLDK